ncbi:MAG TPA: aminotransferase class III-fold pyridoxal phosphate-dependent enzyme [Thermoanaerobaculia bacterium]|nr:aminotransferase class III-fold pyridoxal phosphate-dependent enzyme [Thermoanaerobaculia bacterium]
MAEAKKAFSHLLGLDPAAVDEDISFIQLGAESIILLQFSQALQKSLGVKVHFRSLIEEFVSLRELTEHLETIVSAQQREVLSAAAPRPPATAAAAVTPPAAVVDRTPVPRAVPVAVAAAPVALPAVHWEPALATASGPLAALLDRQLQLMDLQLRVTTQQLELLGQGRWNGEPPAPVAVTPRAVASPPLPAAPRPVPVARAEATVRTAAGHLQPAPFVAHQPAQVRRSSMSETQERHLRGLVEQLEGKARGSKRLTQDYRRYLADNRTAIAFRLAMKELLYPIFVDHAQGARVWDIDGNEYIDVTMGFGTLIFGHSPGFVMEALKRQSERGLGIGLEPPLSGPAARLICELTGNDRAGFVNDGTEAIKSAVRLARTLTGRTKLAMFQGAYHGWFDEVMAISRRGGDGQLVTLPMAPGVSPHVAEDVLVLEYCSPESIDILERRGHELAAVVVDPQQTRRPGAFDNIRDFLHDIRRVTATAGAAMILDEVVTGFRIRPGGAQEFYDVRADLVAYGKAVGAGLPIGVVSGKAEYMDGIDGGHWSYSDSSYPRADQTFIQGSYFKHPLVTPAIWEVLRHFQESGPALQEELTGKMERLGRRICAHLEREGLPIEFLHWGSLGNFIFGPEVKYPSVFFYHLLEHGIYVRDARPWFVSTAHTERDLDEVVEAVKASTAAMQAGGFLPHRGEPRIYERQARDVAVPVL